MAHDMLRSEVKRLRDALSAKSGEVLTLENRAAQLELTIEASKREVEGARAVQRMEAAKPVAPAEAEDDGRGRPLLFVVRLVALLAKRLGCRRVTALIDTPGHTSFAAAIGVDSVVSSCCTATWASGSFWYRTPLDA